MYKIAIIGAYSAIYFGVCGVFMALNKFEDYKKRKALKARISRHYKALVQRNKGRELIEVSREFSAWVRTPRLNAGKEVINGEN